MIEELENKLSRKNLIYKHLTWKQNMILRMHWIYLSMFLLFAIVGLLIKNRNLFIIYFFFILLFIIDMLRTKKRNSIIGKIITKQYELKKKALLQNPYIKEKEKDESVNFFDLYKKLRMRMIKNHMKGCDMKEVLEILRYRENSEKTIYLFIMGALIVFLSDRLVDVLDEISFLKRYKELISAYDFPVLLSLF